MSALPVSSSAETPNAIGMQMTDKSTSTKEHARKNVFFMVYPFFSVFAA
jgi:hypothetical protein